LENKTYFRWFAVSTCPPGLVQTGPGRSRQVRTGPDMPPGLALAGPDMSE